MPFQYYIDTQTEGVDVSLEVFNNILTFYFDGAQYVEGEYYRDQWQLIHRQFLSKLAYYNPNPIEGTDAIHLKKAHVSIEDVKRCHIHIEFNRKIHPSMLGAYLKAFLETEQTIELDNRLLSPDENFEKVMLEFNFFYKDASIQIQEQKIILKQQFNDIEGPKYLSFLHKDDLTPKSEYKPLQVDELNNRLEWIRNKKNTNYKTTFLQEHDLEQKENQSVAKKNKLN